VDLNVGVPSGTSFPDCIYIVKDLWLHEYFSKVYIRKGIRRVRKPLRRNGRKTRKLPPEGPEVPETFAKRPGGPAILSPEGKEVPHDQKFA